jgi:hypothetical protein
MPPPRLRSPFARAVLPVAGGLVFFALLGLATWLVALYLSRNADTVDVRLGDRYFEVGRVDVVADQVAADGPLLFQDLKGTSARRSIVVDHRGTNDFDGWDVYYASPADRPDGCVVEQVRGTDRFVDCEGRSLEVGALRAADDVEVRIEDDRLVIDLGAADGVATTLAASGTG